MLGCVFMYAMINVYMINTVVTWFNVYTPLSFLMTVVVGGLLLSHLVIVAAKDTSFSVDRNIIILAFVAVTISLVVTAGKASFTGDIQSSVVKASELVDGLGCYIGIQVALMCAGLFFWALPMINEARVNPMSLTLALVLILASELVGRGLFYSLHMTSGL